MAHSTNGTHSPCAYIAGEGLSAFTSRRHHEHIHRRTRGLSVSSVRVAYIRSHSITKGSSDVYILIWHSVVRSNRLDNEHHPSVCVCVCVPVWRFYFGGNRGKSFGCILNSEWRRVFHILPTVRCGTARNVAKICLRFIDERPTENHSNVGWIALVSADAISDGQIKWF